MLIASISCVMMLARLLVYVYRAYMYTTVTAQGYNYACVSRRTASQSDVCRDKNNLYLKKCNLFQVHLEALTASKDFNNPIVDYYTACWSLETHFSLLINKSTCSSGITAPSIFFCYMTPFNCIAQLG